MDRDGSDIRFLESPGLRRRHSSLDEGRAVERTGSDLAIKPAGSTNTANPRASPPLSPPNQPENGDSAVKRGSSDKGQRIRFSEVSRKPYGRNRHGSKSLSLGGSSHPEKRPRIPNLSLDVGKASGSLVSGHGISHSAGAIGSPESPGEATPLSAHPLGTRDRGNSLRRTVVSRSLTGQAESSGASIELRRQGPSAEKGSASRRESWEYGRRKKSHDTLIPASPILEEPPKIPKKDVEAQGPAALPNYESWIQQKAARHKFTRRFRTLYQRARKIILRINEIPSSKDGRHLDVDPSRKSRLTDERTGRPYVPNTIRSSRYNAWNFLPRQLIAQFSKLANFYFLCVAILQMIPGLSTTGRFTTIVPLLFFVSISVAREGYDDLRRYRLDKEENNRSTLVLHAYQPVSSEAGFVSGSRSESLGPIHWARTKWKDLQVGDIVKLERNDAAPADMVLLSSKGENSAAYLETMALDGETNLKSKFPAASLVDAYDTQEKIVLSKAHIVVEDPNLDLYNFEGRVSIGDKTSPLTNNEVMYRGSILRNTPEAVGVVIYSGEECKIRMNASKNPRTKAPALQFLVNRIVIFIVVFVVLLSVYNSAAYEIWSEQYEERAWYLSQAGVAFGPIIVSFIIMFNTMIPLSLYVSLEIIKVVQTLLLNDVDMYDEVSNTPMEARTSTINEELGQISYVFSDKTGTITENVMKFRKISVAGTSWLHDSDLKEEAAREHYRQRMIQRKQSKGKRPAKYNKERTDRPRPSTSSAPLVSSIATSDTPAKDVMPKRWRSNARPGKAQPEMATMEMLQYITRKPYTIFARKARIFLLSLALCHTCLPETADDGTVKFQAASPDESALVQAAQELGYLVIDRSSGVLSIKTFPQGFKNEPRVERYEILDVIEFSSKRKRMSVLVKFPDERICVVSKGADSIMMRLLRLSALANRKVIEIEKKASDRKSMEAHEVIARKSEQVDPRSPISRKSSATSRPSVGGLTMAGGRAGPLRNQVDTWLREREMDVDFSAHDSFESSAHTPYVSAAVPRYSTASAERQRSSLQDDDFELIDESLATDEAAIIERTFQHINDFATEGLRTLLYGFRFMSKDEYAGWKKIYQDATTSLVDRQELVERAGEMVERDLELAGATAIEDKLQKGVPGAIDKLRRANIKMWMLTGDKRETAINIGQSCRLVKDYSSVTVLDQEDGELQQRIAAAIVGINRNDVAHSVVVVDGQTLSTIEAEHPVRALFLDLAIIADSVICCRASPSQKAGLVKAIRHKVRKSITLAIGDGANDIAMIQEAHVGIGITGKEGLQAARTSDYSIAQFRFLTKLLLVHGRWNYLRTCKYTLATFWKEMTFYLTQALYQRWTGYTGTSLYESWSLSMFNTLFTSLPVIFLGIFEKDLAPSTLLAVPELYAIGQRSQGFNVRLYLYWMFLAVTDAVIVFFLPLRLYGFPSLPLPSTTPGRTASNDLYPLGDLAFTSVVVLVSVKLLVLEMYARSIPNLVAGVLCVGGWFLWNIILSATYHKDSEYMVKDGFMERFGRDTNWWATFWAVLCTLFVFEVGVRVGLPVIKECVGRVLGGSRLGPVSRVALYWAEGNAQTEAETFQELEKDPALRARFEEASYEELRQGWEYEKDPFWSLPSWTPWQERKRTKEAMEERRAQEEEEDREREVRELLRTREGTVDVDSEEASRDFSESGGASGVSGGRIRWSHAFPRACAAAAEIDVLGLRDGMAGLEPVVSVPEPEPEPGMQAGHNKAAWKDLRRRSVPSP